MIAVFIVGCETFNYNLRQMIYPIFQLFDLFTDNGCILTIIYRKKKFQHFLGGILHTSHRSSHTSITFSATPIASRINGTGIKAAADCSTFKACFPVAMIYCPVEGTTSRGLSDDIWIMCVRDKAGYESILSPPPWNLSPSP